MKRNIVEDLYSVFPPFKTEWSKVQGCIVNTDWDRVERTVSQRLAEGVSCRPRLYNSDQTLSLDTIRGGGHQGYHCDT